MRLFHCVQDLYSPRKKNQRDMTYAIKFETGYPARKKSFEKHQKQGVGIEEIFMTAYLTT